MYDFLNVSIECLLIECRRFCNILCIKIEYRVKIALILINLN